jgi:hypothetical protein
MKRLIYTSVIVGTLALTGIASADHDKECKNIHGKVTIVTDEAISVNEKLYKVGDSTRITKGDKKVKLSEIHAGDLVCVDTRGKDDIGREVAAVTVLTAPNPPTREKQYVREKETVRQISHSKNCDHVHGKVTRIEESTVTVNGKPYAIRETTRVLKDGQVVSVKTIKAGDFLCLDADDANVEGKVTTVWVLAPEEAAQFAPREREYIREREEIKEKLPEQK